MPRPNSGKSRRSESKAGPVVFFDDGAVARPKGLAALRALALSVLRSEGKPGEVHVVFCGDATVRSLNNSFRGLDKTTDVLSFPWETDENSLFEEPQLGEIYVSLPQVERQAPEYGDTARQELERVTVHGLLHLCGHDHMRPAERREMRALEERYLNRDLYAKP